MLVVVLGVGKRPGAPSWPWKPMLGLRDCVLLHFQANLKSHEKMLAGMVIDTAQAVVASRSFAASAAVAAALVPALAAECNVVDKC